MSTLRVWVVAVLLAGTVATACSSPRLTYECRITPAGAEYRRTHVLGEPGMEQNGKVGDRYQPTSGCLAEDETLRRP